MYSLVREIKIITTYASWKTFTASRKFNVIKKRKKHADANKNLLQFVSVEVKYCCMISFLFRFLILVLIRDYVRQDKLDFSFCFSVYQRSITKLDFRKHLFSKSVCFDSHYSTRFAGFLSKVETLCPCFWHGGSALPELHVQVIEI